MKQAICIQCHAKPELVNYLIETMPEAFFDFYIHVDKKSNIYQEILRKENVFFADRVNVHWGRFSQVEATLSLFRMIDTEKYSYIHLCSGNDFVAKSPKEIARCFQFPGQEYIECNPLNANCTWSWHGEDRYACYYPQWMIQRPRRKLMRCIRVSYREFVMRTKLFKRHHFPVSEFYGGSSWFSITGGLLRWMLTYISEHPEYEKHFKHGVCVDEVFFSTLARISPYADRISNRHLRYMKWEGSTSGGPQVLTASDAAQFQQSEAIWARKFEDLQTIQTIYSFLVKDDKE